MQEPIAQEMGREMLRFHRLYGEKISRRFRQLHIDRLSQTCLLYTSPSPRDS